MSTQNPTAAVMLPQHHELHSDTTNGHSFKSSYPAATARYEDIAQSSELFWEKLRAFHKSFGAKFMVPTVGGKALDLHHLFVEVTSCGGIKKVIRDRKWKEVIAAFNFPSTITSASFVLRKCYLSLLYHFEQVYHFNKQVLLASETDAVSGSLVNGSATPEEGNQLAVAGSQQLQIGCSVSGIIDGKFDNGYLVTVNLGSDQLKGVIYHIPHTLDESQDSHASDLPHRQRRKRSRLALHDPSQLKSNSNGYDYFSAEHYAQPKPLHYGQEKVVGENIGLLQNNITGAEKQVYLEKGLEHKEGHKNDILGYSSSYVQ